MKKEKYKRGYAEKLIEYFCLRGEAAKKKIEFPTLTGFAESIGVRLSDILRWRDGNAEFSKALELVRRCMREYIRDCVLAGSLSVAVAKFILEEYDNDVLAGGKNDGSFTLRISFEHGPEESEVSG